MSGFNFPSLPSGSFYQTNIFQFYQPPPEPENKETTTYVQQQEHQVESIQQQYVLTERYPQNPIVQMNELRTALDKNRRDVLAWKNYLHCCFFQLPESLMKMLVLEALENCDHP